MAAGRLEILVERVGGLNISSPLIELRGVAMEFVDDPRKNRMKFEDLVDMIRVHLESQQIIDIEEPRN